MTVTQSAGAEGYESKDAIYFAGARRDFVELLPSNREARILEIGCGAGGTGALAFRDGKCGTYVGVELMAAAAQEAKEHLSEVIVGDIEKLDLPFRPNEFDALIMSEVLEHLADPWHVLRKLMPALKPGATVLASSPNVSHFSVIWQLLRGRFDLEDSGIMDRTHLRWFTPQTYPQLFEACGYQVIKSFPRKRLILRQRIYSALCGGADHFHIKQICVHATKPEIRTP